MENNNAPMFERLSAVLGSIEQPNKPSLRTRLKDEELAASLWSQYQQALTSYLHLIRSTICPVLLSYPFVSFYFHQPNHALYTLDNFKYGDRLKSKIITPQTFPSFLVNVCKLCYVKGEQADRLYNALFELIKNFPGNRLLEIINRIKYYDPIIAILIQTQPLFLQSPTGNLYFDSYILL